ncbi:MAG: outer membrane lipoprotein carrier protein LolA, partial [Myxococcales bacterium]|nr:outer membrane lipoprotein carrier protein LolA [Myxococcales bacterium]
MSILSRRSLALGASGLAMSALVPSGARGDERTPITGAKLDELFAEVARARKGAKSFAGPFTQTRKMGLMKAQIVSQGRVSLVLPDRLRWELFPPDEIVYFVT